MKPRNRIETKKHNLFLLWAMALSTALSFQTARADVDSIVKEIESAGVETAASKNVFGRDTRVPIRTNRYPWSSVGKLVSGTGGACTGTLVGRRLVLTAAHCVFEEGVLQALTFYPNAVDGQSLTSSPAVRTYWGTKDPGSDPESDWAIVVLKHDLGSIYGSMGVKNISADDFPADFIVAGYSGDFASGNTAAAAVGKNRGAHGGVVYHDSPTSRGSSGGPVVVAGEGESLMIVGVNVAEKRMGGEKSLAVSYYDDAYANIAIGTDGFIKTIKDLRDLGY